MSPQVRNMQGTDQFDSSEVSGVSWGAVWAGAAFAAVLSMIFILLGTGIGFSAVSPWQNQGMSARALGVSAVVWLAITQIIASGLGGYLSGRLRVKWSGAPIQEVHFRDAAHGLLAWAVASLVVATVVSSGLANVAGKGIEAGTSVVSSMVGAAGSAATNSSGASGGDTLSYYVDAMLRPGSNATGAAGPASPDNPAATTADQSREVAAILANSVMSGGLSADDRNYLGSVVARRTGMSQADATARVDAIYNRVSKAVADTKYAAQQAADSARKATARTALWMVVSLLAGAIVASLAALLGGNERDHDRPMPLHKTLGSAS